MDCAELIAETAHLVEALAASRPEPRRRRWPGAARLAAAAALIAAAGVLLYLRLEEREPPTLPAAQLAAVLQAHPQLLDHLRRWPVDRGDAAPEVLSGQSFRLGSLLVDAELALGLRQPRRAAPALAAMGGILRQAGLVQAQAEWLDAAAAAAADGAAPPPAALAELEAALAERFLPTELALGKWCEAARLAAVAPDPRFFGDPDHRRLLVRLERSRGELDPEAAARLAAVAETWRDGPPAAASYKELAQALADLQTHYSR